MEWMEEFEKKVMEARRVVAGLRKENRALKAKVRRLESRAVDSEPQAGDDWERERRQIRERVARLAEHLEELLGER